MSEREREREVGEREKRERWEREREERERILMGPRMSGS